MIAAVLALQATDARTIYKRVSPAICTVTQSVMKGESTGTGFAVNGGWQIVTASHVVPSEWGEIQVSGRIKCALVYRDREADVAILRPSRKLPYSIALAKREPEIGATVFSVGQALGALENTMVSGMFNGRRVVEGEAMYQHSAPLSSGMSGGPLLDESGLVIGVNKYKTAENAGLNFSSTLPALRKAIKDAAGIVRSEIRISKRPRPNAPVVARLGQAMVVANIHKAKSTSSGVYFKTKPYQYLYVLADDGKGWLTVLMSTGVDGFIRSTSVELLPQTYKVSYGK